MNPISLLRRSTTTLTLLLAAGCAAVGPDYAPPTLELPPAWNQPREAGLTAGASADGAWWQQFHDPLLNDLIQRALAQNLDLKAAFARLNASRALRGVAAAGQWPTLDGRASYEYRDDSTNTPFGSFIPHTDIHAIGVDAAWELDLWGRVRRSIEAAERDLDVSAAEVQGAMLSVAAEVARAYVELRASQRRLQIAEANLSLQEQTLTLVRARAAAGLVVERDVAQAATNAEQTRSRLPSLETDGLAAQHRLAVLLGRAPGELTAELSQPAPLPAMPVSIAVGVPADLLRRRPDVRAAERRFAAEVARIGAAEAERYPQFSLNGTLGLAANSADEVFAAGSDVVAFGPSIRWNLFDGGRLRQRVKALEANAEAAQIAWEQTVLLALEEAENAMVRFVREQTRQATLQRAAAQARRAVELAQTQYRAGLSDFQAVIDSERTAAAIDDDLVFSGAAVAASVVAMFQALGGGVVPEVASTRAGG